MADNSNLGKVKQQLGQCVQQIAEMQNGRYAKYYSPEVTNGLKELKKLVADAVAYADKMERKLTGRN